MRAGAKDVYVRPNASELMGLWDTACHSFEMTLRGERMSSAHSLFIKILEHRLGAPGFR